jgi:hypothetical protein
MARIKLLLAPLLLSICFGQDAEIQRAIDHGKSVPAKKLWEELVKKQGYLINHTGFKDVIQKKVIVLSDFDRIALEVAEAHKQLREMAIEDVKKNVPFGLMEIVLESGSSALGHEDKRMLKWTVDGGAHVVIRLADGTVIQPSDKQAGGNDSKFDVLSWHEHALTRSRFWFPAQPASVKTFTVIVISDDGKQKEKEVENPSGILAEVAQSQKTQTSPSPDLAPPPAPPVEITPGMTVAQVQSALGLPAKTMKFGDKEIQVFSAFKVTFLDGKVTNVE